MESPEIINPLRSEAAERFSRTIDRIPAQNPGGGGAPFLPPMWLRRYSSTEVFVTDATVNGITPTDIATAIDISGTDATWNIYLHATLGADGIPTAVEVVASTSAIPSDTSGNAYLRIGSAVVASGVITSVSPTLAWSQTFITCGRDPADPTTTPGTYFWTGA